MHCAVARCTRTADGAATMMMMTTSAKTNVCPQSQRHNRYTAAEISLFFVRHAQWCSFRHYSLAPQLENLRCVPFNSFMRCEMVVVACLFGIAAIRTNKQVGRQTIHRARHSCTYLPGSEHARSQGGPLCVCACVCCMRVQNIVSSACAFHREAFFGIPSSLCDVCA